MPLSVMEVANVLTWINFVMDTRTVTQAQMKTWRFVVVRLTFLIGLTQNKVKILRFSFCHVFISEIKSESETQ